MWNHSYQRFLIIWLKGMQLETFREFDWSPYACFRHVEEFEKGKWRIPQFGNKIPLVFALVAQKI
jgi:hypothetical protein